MLGGMTGIGNIRMVTDLFSDRTLCLLSPGLPRQKTQIVEADT